MSQKTMELYIHIPFCVKKCQYCDFLSFAADEATQAAYVEALLREIAYYGPHCSDYLVSTVYIGGGTPSWLTEEWMAQIMSAVRRSFRLASDAEISIECNPGTVTDHKFAVYRNAGINRISIGLQSAVDEELKILGRIHTFDQFLKTYELGAQKRIRQCQCGYYEFSSGTDGREFCPHPAAASAAETGAYFRLFPDH